MYLKTLDPTLKILDFINLSGNLSGTSKVHLNKTENTDWMHFNFNVVGSKKDKCTFLYALFS